MGKTIRWALNKRYHSFWEQRPGERGVGGKGAPLGKRHWAGGQCKSLFPFNLVTADGPWWDIWWVPSRLGLDFLSLFIGTGFFEAGNWLFKTNKQKTKNQPESSTDRVMESTLVYRGTRERAGWFAFVKGYHLNSVVSLYREHPWWISFDYFCTLRLWHHSTLMFIFLKTDVILK